MNFQDSLKSTYRDIEEVNRENRSKRNEDLLQKAKDTFETVKKLFLQAARKGECTEVDGKKIVVVSFFMPTEFLEKSNWKKPRKYGKTFWGKTVVTEPESWVSRFDIKPEMLADYNLFISYLTELASEEGVVVKGVFLQNKRTQQRENIPYSVEGIFKENELDWSLFVECETEIPERYSNDYPVEVVVSTETIEVKKISIDEMEGHDFERYCASVLKAIGYDIELTPGSGDQGVDIIAYKDGIKYGIQCKCYASDIGNKAVQEAFAGKAYYKCHVGVVLTNRYFTRAAKELAETNGIALWDRDILLSFIKRTKK